MTTIRNLSVDNETFFISRVTHASCNIESIRCTCSIWLRGQREKPTIFSRASRASFNFANNWTSYIDCRMDPFFSPKSFCAKRYSPKWEFYAVSPQLVSWTAPCQEQRLVFKEKNTAAYQREPTVSTKRGKGYESGLVTAPRFLKSTKSVESFLLFGANTISAARSVWPSSMHLRKSGLWILAFSNPDHRPFATHPVGWKMDWLRVFRR